MQRYAKSDTKMITIIGAAHVDQTMLVVGQTNLGRTNPARIMHTPGGVAANIARAFAAFNIAENPLPVAFVGAAAIGDDRPARMLDLAEINGPPIQPYFARLDGSPPRYTAMLDCDGELIIGAADMALYERVTPADILSLLEPLLSRSVAVVIDANFPQDTICAIAAALPSDTILIAAGTSPQKVERLHAILPRLDALVLNRAEAIRLSAASKDASDHHKLTALAQNLLSRLGNGHVLVSDGGKVAVLAHDQGTVTQMPPKIDMVNANGAGDAMAAAFVQLLLSGPKTDEAGLRMLLSGALEAGARFAATQATNANI